MLTVSHKILSVEILIAASSHPNYWPELTITTIGLPTFMITFLPAYKIAICTII